MGEQSCSKSKKLDSGLGFLLGFLCSSDIIYVFALGNSVIHISVALSLLIIFVRMLFDKAAIPRVDIGFCGKLFLFFVLFSFFPMLIYMCSSGYMYRYFFGLVELSGYILILLATLLLGDYKKDIYIGLSFGFIANIIISLLAYRAFVPYANNPVYLRIYSVFPQESVFIRSAIFRPAGLFKEPSYYIGYLIVLFFLFFPVLKNVYIKSIFVLFDILLIFFSGSGNIIVFIISLLVYFMLTIKTHHNAITLVVRRSTFYIVCVFAIGILYYLFGMNGWQSVSSAVSWSFSGGSISNSIDRYNNIIRSIKLIPEIPLGTGYNMIYSYNQVYHPELGSLGSYSYGTSSFILKLILEIGFLGALAYVGFILNCSKKLLRYKYNLENNIGLAVSLLSIFLLQSMNGIAYKPYFMVAFGLALYELRKV